MKKINMVIESCDDCPFYRYIRCYGNDCFHEGAPEERGDEPLAENREGDFPKWCPLEDVE